MMNINDEQKQVKLKMFLKKLAEDGSLKQQVEMEKPRMLSDLLQFADYLPQNENIDMAKLLSLLLRKLEFEFDAELMVEHVINGGTVDGLMSNGKTSIHN